MHKVIPEKIQQKNVPNVSIVLIDPELENHESMSTINFKYDDMTTMTPKEVPSVFIDLSVFMSPTRLKEDEDNFLQFS